MSWVDESTQRHSWLLILTLLFLTATATAAPAPADIESTTATTVIFFYTFLNLICVETSPEIALKMRLS